MQQLAWLKKWNEMCDVDERILVTKGHIIPFSGAFDAGF